MTRNSSFFKVVHCREEEDETSEYEFDNVLEGQQRQEHNVQRPVRDTTHHPTSMTMRGNSNQGILIPV